MWFVYEVVFQISLTQQTKHLLSSSFLLSQWVIQVKVEVGHRVWDPKLPNSKKYDKNK